MLTFKIITLEIVLKEEVVVVVVKLYLYRVAHSAQWLVSRGALLNTISKNTKYLIV